MQKAVGSRRKAVAMLAVFRILTGVCCRPATAYCLLLSTPAFCLLLTAYLVLKWLRTVGIHNTNGCLFHNVSILAASNLLWTSKSAMSVTAD